MRGNGRSFFGEPAGHACRGHAMEARGDRRRRTGAASGSGDVLERAGHPLPRRRRDACGASTRRRGSTGVDDCHVRRPIPWQGARRRAARVRHERKPSAAGPWLPAAARGAGLGRRRERQVARPDRGRRDPAATRLEHRPSTRSWRPRLPGRFAGACDASGQERLRAAGRRGPPGPAAADLTGRSCWGNGAISRVEVSTDGGRHLEPRTAGRRERPKAWARWTFRLDAGRAGRDTLQARPPTRPARSSRKVSVQRRRLRLLGRRPSSRRRDVALRQSRDAEAGALRRTRRPRRRALGARGRAALGRARRSGGLVLLAGEAGMGKTRLAHELADRARGSAGTCSGAAARRPSWRCPTCRSSRRSATTSRERRRPRSTPSSAAPRASSACSSRSSSCPTAEPPVGDPAQAKLRLFESVVAVLRAAARDRGVLLVVDDIHWADGSTRELLDHLARRLKDVPALVLCTYRSDELATAPSAAADPAGLAARAPRRDGLAHAAAAARRRRDDRVDLRRRRRAPTTSAT